MALVAMFVALMVGSGWALAMVPNVELVTALAFTAGATMGPVLGAVTGASGMFLFSATFYPLEVYPPAIQQFVKLSPLYHGAELLRGFTLGVIDPSMLGHVAFLLIMGLVGGAIASRRLTRLLTP